MKIGILSDTHGWIHPELFNFFREVDEIWHAGDIGDLDTAERLALFKPLRAVYGNIDGMKVRTVYGETLRFRIEERSIYMTHIGGYPGRYFNKIRNDLILSAPDIFVCGHSHIARVEFDRKEGFLFINPGAAGFQGFHKVMTAIRLQIDGQRIHDLDLIELGDRGRKNI